MSRYQVHTRWLVAAIALGLFACGKAAPKDEAAPSADKSAAPVEGDKPAEAATAKAAKADEEGEQSKAAAAGDYQLKLVPAAKGVDFSLVRDDPDNYVKKTFACSNLLAPSPKALSAFMDKKNLSLIEEKVDDRRVVTFCRKSSDSMKSTPVTVYFPEGSKGAILFMKRGTVFNVEVRGVRSKQVVGVFRGVVSGARKDPGGSKPDLLSGLIWPERLKDKSVVCRSTLPVVPKEVRRFDSKAVALVGDDHADKKGQLRCEDRRGASVSVELYFPKAKSNELLKLGRGTEVKMQIKGFDRNQLVATFEEVVSGGMESKAGDLKSMLLDIKPHIGKEASCKTRIAPSHSPVGMLDRKPLSHIKGSTDDVWASLMCGDVGEGVVHVRLYFKKGAKEELLKIGSESSVKFVVWGVHQNQLIALYSGVKAGAIKPGGPKDWRRISLSTKKYVGQKLTCDIALKPYLSKLKIIGSQKKALLRQQKDMGERHGVITCKDSAHKFGGTRVEVYFAKKDEAMADKLNRGDKVAVRLLGAVYNSMIVAYAGRQ